MKRRKKRIVSQKRREKIDAAIAGMKQDLEKESAKLKSAADGLGLPDVPEFEMNLDVLDLQFPPELEMRLPELPDILDMSDLDMPDLDLPGLDLP